MTTRLLHHDIALIVDDVPDNLALLCDALDAADYMVLVATDGFSALERLSHITPDVILLDAVMPGLDGFQTCERIKASESAAHVPVIFMTGLTETEHILKAFAAGGVDYVTKPISPDEVIARVGTHIRNARLLRQARETIDSAGNAVIVVDGTGTPIWWSRRARELVRSDTAHAEANDSLLHQLRQWLLQCITQIERQENPICLPFPDTALIAKFVGAVAKEQYLVRFDVQESTPSDDIVTIRFGLTGREREVLNWLAKGKTNRDIADILGMSPRTVNKHLEHIYVKLGVETRTAAAAMARGIAPSSRPNPNPPWNAWIA